MNLAHVLAKRSQARKNRVRNKIRKCSTLTHRVIVSKSNKYIYATLFNEVAGKSEFGITSASLEGGLGKTIADAYKVGQALGKYCLEKGISKVAFDRGMYLYHGKIKSIADGLRDAGVAL